MNYTPEQPFQITDDKRMVYNLRHHSWNKGKETFENDVAINIEAWHLPDDVRAELARIVCDALNSALALGSRGWERDYVE